MSEEVEIPEWRQIAPFAVVVVAAFVAVVVPLPLHEGESRLTAAAAGLAVLVAGGLRLAGVRRRSVLAAGVLVTGFGGVVMLLRHAEGGWRSGLSPLVLLPVVWFALYGSRRELLAAVAGAVLTLLIPIVTFGPPAYPAAEWRRVLVWLVVAPMVGLTVQSLVREVRSRAEVLTWERQRTELVLAAVGEGIAGLDARGKVTFINSAGERLTGWSRHDLLGQDQHDTLHHTHRDGRTYSQSDCPIYEVLRTGTPAHGDDDAFWRKDGTSFPVEYQANPIVSHERIEGAVVMFRDVSAQRNADRLARTRLAVTEALAHSGSRDDPGQAIVQAVGRQLDSTVVTLWGNSGSGRLAVRARWNRPDSDVAHTGSSVDDSDADAQDRFALQVCRSGEALWLHESRPTADKSAASPRVVLPLAAEEEVLGVLEILGGEVRRDDHAVAELSSLGGQLGQLLARKRAEAAADHAKDQFFALISHELRTPLTAISGYLELLIDDEVATNHADAGRRQFLEVIARNVRRLQRLVSDLLFVAQFEAGSLTLVPAPVDLASLVIEAVESIRPRAAQRDVELTVTTDARPGLTADPDRVAQVVDNLLTNAVKFTPPGGHVDLVLAADKWNAILEVADTGVGIPASELPHLFNRFARTASAVQTATPGVGLGLFIVKAIVEGHGGTIEVKSQEGTGTTFRVHLPIQETAHGPRTPREQS